MWGLALLMQAAAGLALALALLSARKWTHEVPAAPARDAVLVVPSPVPNVRLGVFIPTVGRAELLDRLLDCWNASAAREPNASVKVYVLVDGAVTPERAAATHAVLARWPFAQALTPTTEDEPPLTEGETAGWSERARRSVHLAHVYRQLLDAAFLRQMYRHAVLWEDDLLPSLDIVTYFAQATTALEADPSLWCASAWSDNSFPAVAEDSAAVLRGEHFMGLGFLMKVDVYLERLRPLWPPDDFFARNPAFPDYPREWDDFMRVALALRSSASAADGCLYPEVARSHHMLGPDPTAADPTAAGPTVASSSVHSTTAARQAARFDPMRLAVPVSTEALAAAMKRLAPVDAYDAWLAHELGQARPVATLDPAVLATLLPWPPQSSLVYVCATCTVGNPRGGRAPKPAADGWTTLLAGDLGLAARGPDGVVRGLHRGVVGLRWLGHRLWIVGGDSPLMPPSHHDAPAQPGATLADVVTMHVGAEGAACTAVCKAASPPALHCLDGLLPLANRCRALLDAFPGIDNCLPGNPAATGLPSAATTVAFLSTTAQLACASPPPPGMRRLCPCIPLYESHV